MGKRNDRTKMAVPNANGYFDKSIKWRFRFWQQIRATANHRFCFDIRTRTLRQAQWDKPKAGF